MAAIPVKVKHQGKLYDVELDPTATGETFKFQLYSLTGVEPERQKVLVKGGQLKDDTDLSKLNAKAGQTFMMMGTPSTEGASLVRPQEKVKFLEDMTEAEAARLDGATPAGLENLGNTCYLNSTLQVMRAMPELQEQLTEYTPSASSGPSAAQFAQFGLEGLGARGTSDVTKSLRDLYKQMSETQDGFPPYAFLQTFRAAFPQFAERARTGQGFAQQDAEEAWSQILSQLRSKLKTAPPPAAGASASVSDPAAKSYVDRYMAGQLQSELKCDEKDAAELGEMAVESEEEFLKLNCHITKDTNHLTEGIRSGLEEKLEKNSEVLGREAVYTKKSRIARLPKYLTVHFVRFFWKREAQKKAKIMRKVTFPPELDVVEFCTETLQKQLIPVRDKVREVRKDEEDMVRARKRQKRAHQQESDRAADAAKTKEPLQTKQEKADKSDKEANGDTEMTDEVFKTDAEYEAEKAEMVKKAKKELHDLVKQQSSSDETNNKSGIYELRGIVTHQGASADSGHYTAYVKKQGPIDSKTGKRKEEDGKWWWFNDDKVSEVDAEKVETLSGGGESHSALILLYRAIDLPTDEDVDQGSAA